MSHEIRTPMNGVLGFTHLLLDTPLNSEQRDHVTTIQHSAESLLTIINDILDFSKIEAGKLTVERVPFDLQRAAEEVIDLLTPQANKKGIEIALKIHPAVPNVVHADPGRVRQVMLNLLGNAVKFTKRGHVILELDVVASAQLGRRDVRISVEDTGVGIPLEKQPLMFNQFAQADASTTREFGGTGLGLAISKRLVELMGGQIGFTSEQGKGSRFWFTLATRVGDVILQNQPIVPDLASARILIVDDLEVNRRLLVEMLTRWNISCAAASSGSEALETMSEASAQGKPFTIAILDYLMPHMDGLELAYRIKEDPELKDTALVMFTSGNQRTTEPMFVAAGFSAFLTKPLKRPGYLLDALLQACGSKTSSTGPTVASAPETPTMARSSVTDLPFADARVLVAEDNIVNQRLIERMLQKLGCRVDIAASGDQAVAMAQQTSYDLVFMDCFMPVMDGYQATAELRRIEAPGTHLPIVALTANAMADEKNKCLAAGMDDYLSKPVYQDKLRETMARWIKPRAEEALESIA